VALSALFARYLPEHLRYDDAARAGLIYAVDWAQAVAGRRA